MAKPRVTATDRLANVMDVVGLGRRTGLLSAEREFGTMLEEAEVYFVSGNPIYATLGPLHGHEALYELAQWGSCRFCFDPVASQPIPNISGVLPAIDPSSPSGLSYAYAPSMSSPANSFGANSQYGPSSSFGRSPTGPSSPISRTSWTSPASAYPSGSLGRMSGIGASQVNPGVNPGTSSPHNAGGNPGASGANWSASGFFGVPADSLTNDIANGLANGVSRANLNNTSDPITPSAARPNSNPAMINPAMINPAMINPAMMPVGGPDAQANLQRRPRRATDVRDLINVVTRYNLSRAHRTVLLLADGEHSTLDLARLSGKPMDEVLALLGELEGRGLIYYSQ